MAFTCDYQATPICLAFSGDGRLAAGTEVGEVVILSAEGEQEWSFRIGDRPLSAVAWSPQATRLALATDREIVVDHALSASSSDTRAVSSVPDRQAGSSAGAAIATAFSVVASHAAAISPSNVMSHRVIPVRHSVDGLLLDTAPEIPSVWLEDERCEIGLIDSGIEPSNTLSDRGAGTHSRDLQELPSLYRFGVSIPLLPATKRE